MKIYSIKQLEVNPSGIGNLWGAFYPGRDPGYWKVTPLVSFITNVINSLVKIQFFMKKLALEFKQTKFIQCKE
jgi:hypothetical protein